MTVFALKIIAMISMILDHVKYAIPDTRCFVTEYLGRLAFPIFAFLISEGFIHTHSKPKYILRMLIFAMISEVPFYMFSHYIAHSKVILNVMFTFELALLGLWMIDFFKNYEGISKILNYAMMITGLLMLFTISYYVHPDYGWYGVLLVWLFYMLKKSKILTSLFFSMLVVIYYLSLGYIQEYKSILFTLSSLIFILLYNGKQGKKLKYFFYVFYPAHFIILYTINYFLIK